MAVIYRGKTPDRNYSITDFYNNGVVISWMAKYILNNKPAMRCIFRANGLLGEIRSCGNNFAVDVRWGWSSNFEVCLTTECKSVREAKSILFEWFKSKGFVVPKSETDKDWEKDYLKFDNIQLNLNPFIFRK